MKKAKSVVYEEAFDIKEKISEIIKALEMHHIKQEYIACLRSRNTKTNAIARCYALSKPFQIAFRLSPRYIIEVISEKFDKLNDNEKARILIHELLHIPKSFGGGFRHHDFVNTRAVEMLFRKYKNSVDKF